MLCEHSIVDIPLSCVHLTTASSQWIRFTESAAYLCWTWWIDLSWRFNRLKWFRLAAQLWERENVFDSKRFKSIIDFNVRNSDLTNLLNAFHSEKLMIREESSLSWFLSTLIGSWSIHGILYAFEVISSTFQCVSSRLKRLQVIAILQDLCMLQFSILSFSSGVHIWSNHVWVLPRDTHSIWSMIPLSNWWFTAGESRRSDHCYLWRNAYYALHRL